MPTPNGVNYLLQFLITFFQFPNCQKQESKVDVLCLMSLCRCYVTIRCFVFRVLHYIILFLIFHINQFFNRINKLANKFEAISSILLCYLIKAVVVVFSTANIRRFFENSKF